MGHDVVVADVLKGERTKLVPILEESFEGLYLWHAKRTLQGIESVRVARTVEGEDAGLVMLKILAEGPGYVYYVAVPPRFRGKGIGGRLLDEGLSFFVERAVPEVYASVEEENVESNKLFSSRGFEKVRGSDLSERYGRLRSLLMYREMMVVRGEVLLCKRFDSKGT